MYVDLTPPPGILRLGWESVSVMLTKPQCQWPASLAPHQKLHPKRAMLIISNEGADDVLHLTEGMQRNKTNEI